MKINFNEVTKGLIPYIKRTKSYDKKNSIHRKDRITEVYIISEEAILIKEELPKSRKERNYIAEGKYIKDVIHDDSLVEQLLSHRKIQQYSWTVFSMGVSGYQYKLLIHGDHEHSLVLQSDCLIEKANAFEREKIQEYFISSYNNAIHRRGNMRDYLFRHPDFFINSFDQIESFLDITYHSKLKLKFVNIRWKKLDRFIQSSIEEALTKMGDPIVDRNTTKQEFIDKYQSELAKSINENLNIEYVPFEGKYNKVDEYAKYLTYRNDFTFLTNQKHMIAAGITHLKKNHALFLISEMGTGKTSMALAMAMLHKETNKNVVVICPTHLNDKWRYDIQKLVPNSIIHEPNDVKDFISNIEPKLREGVGNNFVLVNPKLLRHKYIQSWISKNREAQWSRAKIKNNLIDYGQKYGERAVEEYIKKLWNNTQMYENTHPKSLTRRYKVPLTQIDSGTPDYYAFHSQKILEDVSYEKDFVSLDWYISRKCKNLFDFCIIDELHQYLSDSLQSSGASRIANCSKKVIGLTGTLFNGSIKNIWYLYYNFRRGPFIQHLRSINRREHAYKTIFAKEYALREMAAGYKQNDEENMTPSGRDIQEIAEKYKIINVDDYYLKYEKENGSIESYLHGVCLSLKSDLLNPRLFSDLLIGDCIFMNMSDVSENMPEIRENVILLNLREEDQTIYDKNISILSQRQYGPLEKHALIRHISGWINTGLSWRLRDHNFDQIPLINNNKLEELVKIINHHANERILVYTYFDDNNSVNHSIANQLDKHGIKYSILTDSIKAKDRISWFQKQVDDDVRVVICNPRQIETGVDLLDFTTIVFYELDQRYYTFRQASRRSYRLNQKNPVTLYYLVYKDTVQENLINYMAEKVRSVKLMEGEFDDEGLAALASPERDPSEAIFTSMTKKEKIEQDDDVFSFNKYAEAITKEMKREDVVVKITPVKKKLTLSTSELMKDLENMYLTNRKEYDTLILENYISM